MTRFRCLMLFFAAVMTLALSHPLAHGQAMCVGEHGTSATACYVGIPDAHGVALRDALEPGQVRAYRFRVSNEPGAAYVYVGDLWHDLEIALWQDPPDEAELGRALLLAESRAAEQRVLQFVRPGMIVQQLEPGTYTLFVRAGDGTAVEAGRGFTVRVAVGPPVCAMQRDTADRYELALSYLPAHPTAFSLLSFNAFLSPPYSDLFDFAWEIDGQPLGGRPRETAQVAVPDLAGASAEHRIRVTARGVREYPDPDPRFRHVPPTLTVECTFPAP